MKDSRLNDNLAKRISESALLTVKHGDRVNTMTVSWGGFGVLWGKEVCLVFVRPSRFTYGFCEGEDKFTLSFFGKERKKTLSYCGTKSGRDTDKIKDCDLSYSDGDGFVVFDDAQITLKLKKLYSDDIKKECFNDLSPLANYKDGDFHRMYVCEVLH